MNPLDSPKNNPKVMWCTCAAYCDCSVGDSQAEWHIEYMENRAWVWFNV